MSTQINQIERRNIKHQVELRLDGESATGRTITGRAVVYNDFYQLWSGCLETILPGAVDGADMSDVVALFNHENELLLARSTNGKGTLTLNVDDKGLTYSFEAPNTTAGNDTLENVKLGNITGSSFAFSVAEENWLYDVKQADGSTMDVRQIVKIAKIYDVSPVVFPAYSETEVDAMRKRHKENSPRKEINLKEQIILTKLKTRK
jgi:HK97 family phage prohead protease